VGRGVGCWALTFLTQQPRLVFSHLGGGAATAPSPRLSASIRPTVTGVESIYLSAAPNLCRSRHVCAGLLPPQLEVPAAAAAWAGQLQLGGPQALRSPPTRVGPPIQIGGVQARAAVPHPPRAWGNG